MTAQNGAARIAVSTDRSIEDLDHEILRLARQMNAETYRMLLLVRDFDDRFGFAKWGFPSCADWLAWRCGLSLSAAREKVRTAQALRSLPVISAAFADGRLSYSKVRALTRVAANHDEDLLLAYALDATASQVEERCRQIRNVEPEAVETARRAWERRSLTLFRDRSRGVVRIAVELPEADGELVGRAAKGRIETRGARGSRSTSTAGHYQVVVHVDESALRGGAGRSDLPIETVKRLCCDGSVIAITEDERGTPLDVGRKQRTVPTALRRALWSRDRGCSFPGCRHARYVDAHHISHWTDGGDTSLENLTLLCTHHHTLLHEGGFSIHRDSSGDLYFRRPDGRVIPRSGYRAADMLDEGAVPLPGERPSAEARMAAIVHSYDLDDDACTLSVRKPSAEGFVYADAAANRSGSEVREGQGLYPLRAAVAWALSAA